MARGDGDGRSGRAVRSSRRRASGAELAVGADRCLGRRCAFVGTCFSEAARRRAREADLVIVNHALYFADLGHPRAARHVDPSRARRRRLRRGAPARGHRVRLARRRRQSLRPGSRLERDVERACLEAGVPVPARPLDRVRRAGGASDRRRGAALGPPAASRGAADKGRDARRAAGASWRRRWRATNDELDLLARRAAEAAADVEACLDGGRARSRRLGGATARSSGRPSTSRAGSARRSGRAGRRRFSSRRR